MQLDCIYVSQFSIGYKFLQACEYIFKLLIASAFASSLNAVYIASSHFVFDWFKMERYPFVFASLAVGLFSSS